MNGVVRLARIALVVMSFPTLSHADAVTGQARIIDGDTIEVGGQIMRLHGIDAPETRQTCGRHDGVEYPCGTLAGDALADLISGAEVRCHGDQRDGYGRLIAQCTARGLNLNSEMVRRGWAVAFRKYSDRYLAQELEATKAGVGLWRGPFQRPTEFRAAVWAASQQEAPQGCPIKGNISSHGKIYHTPWSRSYKRTRINTARGERWFCTEAEALAAGWRAPLW